jgi:uncharacterized protein (TIGR02147 family)
MRTNSDSNRPVVNDLSMILTRASHVAQALKEIYELRKRQNSKLSMEHLCRKTGIPSKSNLSDVFNGRRKLSLRHRGPLLDQLGVRGLHKTFLSRMMEIEFGKPVDRADLLRELELLKKTLQIQMVEQVFAIHPFAIHIFCALGLFGNQATAENLTKYFRSSTESEVRSALSELEEKGFVIKSSGFYSPKANQVMFQGKDITENQMAFLKQGFQESISATDQYFSQSNVAHFESTILSVKKADYETELQKFKDSLLKFQAAVETGSADLLVRLNIGLFPL